MFDKIPLQIIGLIEEESCELEGLSMQKNSLGHHLLSLVRHYSRVAPPPPVYADPVIRVSNNVAYLGSPKQGLKPRQLLSLPPFPGYPLPGKNSATGHVTAISWLKYYFDEISDSAIQSHFNKGLVSIPYHTILLFLFFLHIEKRPIALLDALG